MNKQPENLSKRPPLALLVIASLVLVPMTGWAQEFGESDEIFELDNFTITGSLLPTTETAIESRAQPVQILDRTQMDLTGFATAEEFLQKLTVNNGGSVPMQNNATGFTPGATSASLRGLGPDTTLVLVNGKRMAPWPTGNGGTTAFVDLNSIPSAAIKRIEVLKDGASATYGADAVAGVINIILNDDFEGAEFTTRYGNDFSDSDSSEFYSSAVFGVGNEDGNITAGAFYYKKNPIFNKDRDFSSTPPFLSSNSIPMNIQISAAAAREALGLGPTDLIPDIDSGSASAQDRLIFATTGRRNPDGSKTGDYIEPNSGNSPPSDYYYSSGRSANYNFNLLSQATPNIERTGGYLNFRRNIKGLNNVEAYGDFSYTRAEALNALAPTATGNFRNFTGVSIVVPARTANPINLPASNVEGVAAAGYSQYSGLDGVPNTADDIFRLAEVPDGAYNPFNPFNQDLEGGSRIRLEEFGNRTELTTATSHVATAGIRGTAIELGDSYWNFDLGLRYSKVDELARVRRVSISSLNRLMNAADPWFDPDSSQFLGTTEPYNPFGSTVFDDYFNENNRAIAENAIRTLKNSGDSSLSFAYGSISTGDLLELPAGEVGLALGFDWRKESISQFPDSLAATGDVAGASTRAITDADREIAAYFTEFSIPLISPGMDAGVHSWDFNVSGRFEDFLTSKRNTFVPKFSTRLALTDEFVVRSSWGEGFREPSLFELFAGKTAGLEPLSNPWTNNTDPEVDTTVAGNPQLKPEESTSYNLGIVYSPKAVQGLTVSVDYWQIKREGFVDDNAQDTVDRIFNSQNTFPGESVIRDAADNLFLVETVFQNAGFNKFSGVDLASSYIHETDNLGTFNWTLNLTWLREALEQDNPNRPIFDFVGYGTETRFDTRDPVGNDLRIGTQDGLPLVITNIGDNEDGYLEFKWTSSLGWEFRGFNTVLSARFYDGFADINSDFELSQVSSRTFFDIQTSYEFFANSESWYADTTLTLGIENLFDKDPPAVFADFNNSTGYPGFLYEPDGRRYYLSITKKL